MTIVQSQYFMLQSMLSCSMWQTWDKAHLKFQEGDPVQTLAGTLHCACFLQQVVAQMDLARWA
jgi:hypothetical protein